MRLWARLALVMSIVAMLSAVFVGGLAMSIAGRQAEADSQAQLRREALLHAEVVGRWLADQVAHAEAWTQVFPTQLPTMSDDLRSGFLAAVYRGMPSAVVVVLVDGDGRAVVPPVFSESGGDRAAADGPRAQQLIQRLPLTEALESGTGVGAPWLPDGLGTLPSVPLAVLAASSDRPEETLVLGMELRLLAATEITAQSNPTHAISLLGDAGEPLVGAGHRLLQPALLRPLLRQDADFRYGEGATEVLGSIVPVPYTRWSAVVLEPAAAVRASATAIRASVIAAASAAVLLATLLAFGLASTVSGPVSRLRDAALALADGRREGLPALERSDEIGELARAFEHMSAQLDAQRGAIEGFNRELQQRVDERTQQLEDAQKELVRSGQLAAVAEVGAGLAHELNNPLASVLGLAQILKARRPDDPLLSDLESEAARCREVVGAMLRFTAGEVDPQNAPVIDLRSVLTDVSALVAGAFKQRGVALELSIADASTPAGIAALAVRMDRIAASRMLAQVLNALRSGLEPGARLTVSAEGPEVGDGLVGLRFATDRSLAATGARRDDWRASGLELWVARQLVDRFGGRLVDATREGDEGAVWQLRLPQASAVGRPAGFGSTQDDP